MIKTMISMDDLDWDNDHDSGDVDGYDLHEDLNGNNDHDSDHDNDDNDDVDDDDEDLDDKPSRLSNGQKESL